MVNSFNLERQFLREGRENEEAYRTSHGEEAFPWKRTNVTDKFYKLSWSPGVFPRANIAQAWAAPSLIILFLPNKNWQKAFQQLGGCTVHEISPPPPWHSNEKTEPICSASQNQHLLCSALIMIKKAKLASEAVLPDRRNTAQASIHCFCLKLKQWFLFSFC